VYVAAVRSVTKGRDLGLLARAIIELNIDGMTKSRAAQISGSLNNKASAVITRERQESLGISQATWLYSGAPCAVDPKDPTPQETRRDAAHKAANGKTYDVSKGMYLNKKWTWPGVEDGCKCMSKSFIPGLGKP
jgi:uncharacterized protein with gpF-like domain